MTAKENNTNWPLWFLLIYIAFYIGGFTTAVILCRYGIIQL